VWDRHFKFYESRDIPGADQGWSTNMHEIVRHQADPRKCPLQASWPRATASHGGLIAERRIRFVRDSRHVRIQESALREFIDAGMIGVPSNRGHSDLSGSCFGLGFLLPYETAGAQALSRWRPRKGRQARGGTTWTGPSTGASLQAGEGGSFGQAAFPAARACS
jgi:hypothetical protein